MMKIARAHKHQLWLARCMLEGREHLIAQGVEPCLFSPKANVGTFLLHLNMTRVELLAGAEKIRLLLKRIIEVKD